MGKPGAARSAFSAMVVAGVAAVVALTACTDRVPSNSRQDGGTKPPEQADSAREGSHPPTDPVGCDATRAQIDAPAGSATALVIDTCCPSTQVLDLVPVVFQCQARTPRGEVVTALGCCLPTGQCGGARPVQVWRGSDPCGYQFQGYTSPDHCSPYSPEGMLDHLILWHDEPPMRSCQYPFRLPGDAATSSVDAAADASIHDASSDRWVDSGDR
jgi:hypothetical protein